MSRLGMLKDNLHVVVARHKQDKWGDLWSGQIIVCLCKAVPSHVGERVEFEITSLRSSPEFIDRVPKELIRDLVLEEVLDDQDGMQG